MARLDEVKPTAAKRQAPRWPVFAGAMSALALAAGVFLFMRHDQAARDGGDPAFAARGGASEHTLVRDVGVRVLTGKQRLVPLSSGATVAADASFTAAFTNLHETAAYLMLFSVDSKGEIHWLYPAYTSFGENPVSVPLRRAATEAVMETSVVLDAPTPGPLRFVSLVTEEPLHVLDVERLGGDTLTKEALQRKYPRAAVSELDVVVTAAVEP
jgi:hypothetical protein